MVDDLDKQSEEAARRKLCTPDGLKFIVDCLADLDERTPSMLDFTIIKFQASAAIRAYDEFRNWVMVDLGDPLWAMIHKIVETRSGQRIEIRKLVRSARLLKAAYMNNV